MVTIDVRSPLEFEAGHKVGAVNMPLFSNEERAEVGTLYKQVGREQAVERGLEFVGPKMAELVRTARRLSGGEPIELYCARGGMRSGSVAWLLRLAGLEISVIKGGYKAYRAEFEENLAQKRWQLVVLSGATGSGKTELLHAIERASGQVLDLEGLANHRGSVFGGIGQGSQPTTEHFINLLHDTMDRFDISRPVFCEGESMLIGHVYMPRALYDLMQSSPQVEVISGREDRLQRIMREYGELPLERLRECFLKISKRMGGEQTKNAVEALDRGDVRTATELGLDYYDKCYKKSERLAEAHVLEISSDEIEAKADELIKKYEKSS